MSRRATGTVTVRAAQERDDAVYARLFGELGLGEPVPSASTIAKLRRAMWIAELDGEPAGFVIAELQSDDGFVRQIVVDPDARRHGVGVALMKHARALFAQRGARLMRLNVIQGNTPALALYAAFGFTIAYDSVALWVEPRVIERMPRHNTRLRCDAPSIFEDATLERQFAIQPGLLSWLRGKESPPTIVRDTRAVRGLMCFSPAWQGSRPFHADSLEVARTLLVEMQRRAPTARRLGLVLERDLTHCAALVTLGATERFYMHHLTARVTAPLSRVSESKREM